MAMSAHTLLLSFLALPDTAENPSVTEKAGLRIGPHL